MKSSLQVIKILPFCLKASVGLGAYYIAKSMDERYKI